MRFSNIKIAKLLGIEVELHFTFHILLIYCIFQGFAQFGWLGALSSLIALILVFTTVLLHELGHCWVAQRFHIEITRILMLPIGGMAQFTHVPEKPSQELLITLAGPAVNFAIAALLLPWVQFETILADASFFSLSLQSALQLLFVINLFMGCFNLLPVFPMDGGRLLRATLALRLEHLKATEIATYIGKVLSICGILISLFHYQNYLTAALFAFIFFAAHMELAQAKWKASFANLTVGDVTRPYRTNDNTLIDLQPNDIPKHFPDTSVLQANWPLELYIDQFTRSSRDTKYPVLLDEKFLGVVQLETLPQNLYWARQRKRFDKLLQNQNI